MKLTVVGCGDAFGAGGRLQTCFHLATSKHAVLIDCGVTALIGMQRCGLDPNAVGTILISHLHGDHFGGLVWWLLHAQHVGRRTAPLIVAGPPGLEARLIQSCEALYPGSTTSKRRYALSFVELSAEQPTHVGALAVSAFGVSHPSGAPSYALRIAADGRTIGFSGDTEWVEALVDCARDADLFITECYGFDEPVRYHMSWRTLEGNIGRLRASRILLSHMNAHMLARVADARRVGVLVAEDGLTLEI